MYASYKKIFKELKNGIEILVGQAVFLSYRSRQSKCCFWINNSRTTWPTLIFDAFFEFFGQFTIRCKYYFFFQKDTDNFETDHRACSFYSFLG